MQTTFRRTLAGLLKARFPLLYVETWEEDRALGEICSVAGDAAAVRTPRRVYTWSRTDGVRAVGGGALKGTTDPMRALDAVMAAEEPSVFVLHDLHPELGYGCKADAAVVRRLRDLVTHTRTGAAPLTAVLMSPVLQLPVELEKSITVVDFNLLNEQELAALLRDMVASNASVNVTATPDERERIINAAVGLTVSEAENAFARAMVNNGSLDAHETST